MAAGYGLFFAFHEQYLSSERSDRHAELVAALGKGLEAGELTLPLPPVLGVQARLLSSGQVSPARRVSSQNGDLWLVSRTRLKHLAKQPNVLEVRQNISELEEHNQQDLLMLIGAGAFSVLFTAALLRFVLWRGLALPLEDLTSELQQLQADSLGIHKLNPANQPIELTSILEAFNHLQGRLAAAWARERSFVDGVAHELRTPITVISGHAQRLQADATQSSSNSVDVIVAEAKRLGDLTLAMLELARVDAGRLALVWVELDPEALLLEAFERLQGLAPDRLQLGSPVEGDLPRIWADPERVHQCLASLVENALRYSDGFVELGVSTSLSAVTLHVEDQGPGIPISEHDQVRERFVRGSTARGTQGSGLGLAICHTLMRAMQGELLIGEAPEGGAVLQLRFKLSARPPAP